MIERGKRRWREKDMLIESSRVCTWLLNIMSTISIQTKYIDNKITKKYKCIEYSSNCWFSSSLITNQLLLFVLLVAICPPPITPFYFLCISFHLSLCLLCLLMSHHSLSPLLSIFSFLPPNLSLPLSPLSIPICLPLSISLSQCPFLSISLSPLSFLTPNLSLPCCHLPPSYHTLLFSLYFFPSLSLSLSPLSPNVPPLSLSPSLDLFLSPSQSVSPSLSSFYPNLSAPLSLSQCPFLSLSLSLSLSSLSFLTPNLSLPSLSQSVYPLSLSLLLIHLSPNLSLSLPICLSPALSLSPLSTFLSTNPSLPSLSPLNSSFSQSVYPQLSLSLSS